jgi:ribosomal protein S18 acetylase RimI-like enzyme
MVEFRQADAARTRRWEDDFRARLADRWTPIGAGAAAQSRLDGWRRAARRELALLVADGAEVGYVTVAYYCGPLFGIFDQNAVVFDLWVEPGHRGRGYGRAARDYAEAWGRTVGAHTMATATWTDEPGLKALYADYPLRNQRMGKRLPPADPANSVPLPAGVSSRPMRPGAEFDAWLAREVAGYAADIADSGSGPAGAAATEAARSYSTYLPDELDTPANAIWVIEADGRPVADIWLKYGFEPDLTYVFGVGVRPEFRGQGYGRAAMLIGEEQAHAAGDHCVGLNVFGHKRVAINLYKSLGYQFVDSTRSISLVR